MAPPKEEQTTQSALPRGFIDAMIRYAVDPSQWEQVAEELDQRNSALSRLDPAAFLSILSRAEGLAWELKNEPAEVKAHIQSPFVLVDSDRHVLTSSDNIQSISDYLEIVDSSLVFADGQSAEQFSRAIASIQRSEQIHSLVELRGRSRHSRFGYLVEAQNLPSIFNQLAPNAAFGLLIAEAQSGDRVRRLVQSSFHLTSAETAIALRLSSGMSLKEIAQTLDISTNTARNHLQSVFEKTGLNRQADLILTLTQLSVLLSVMGGDESQSSPTPAQYPGHQFFIVSSDGSPGRRVAYRQYGTGSRYVIAFHESAGSSRLLPNTTDRATNLGLTIIAPERPGSGFSDPLSAYDFATTASDVAQLVDDLRLPSVSLLGYLSGAAHALVTAALLGEKVDRVVLVAGRGPARYPSNDTGALSVLRRRLLEQPWLLSTFFNILRNRANKETNARILKRVYGGVPHDLDLLEKRHDILEHMVGSSLESLTVSASGLVGEISCFADPEPSDLSGITAPISVWHGKADQVAPLQALRESMHDLHYEERIFDDSGSLLWFEYWEEILRVLSD